MPNAISPICWESVTSYSTRAKTYFPLELNGHAPARELCAMIVCHVDLYCFTWVSNFTLHKYVNCMFSMVLFYFCTNMMEQTLSDTSVRFRLTSGTARYELNHFVIILLLSYVIHLTQASEDHAKCISRGSWYCVASDITNVSNLILRRFWTSSLFHLFRQGKKRPAVHPSVWIVLSGLGWRSLHLGLVLAVKSISGH